MQLERIDPVGLSRLFEHIKQVEMVEAGRSEEEADMIASEGVQELYDTHGATEWD